MERLKMDMIGPLTPSHGDGFVHILNVVDVFTRHATLVPIVNGTAETVLQALQTHVFARLGFPSVVQFDGGKSFDNTLLRTELARLGIEAHRTTPYNHKSQGVVERANGTVLGMVRTLVDGNTSRWADVLWSVERAYNSAVHSSTGVSPDRALLRFVPATPLTLHTQDTTGSSCDPAAHVTRSDADTPQLYTTMAERLRKAAEEQKRQHDKRVVPATFTAGDSVLVYAENRDGNNKLASHWRGPRTVLRRVEESAVLYIVEAPPESGRTHIVVHADHLRPCDESRVTPDERVLYNARSDTFIPERVVTHTGDTPSTYRFLIIWRGWGAVRASWEPLTGRTSSGESSGVGSVTLVRDYMADNGLRVPVPKAKAKKR